MHPGRRNEHNGQDRPIGVSPRSLHRGGRRRRDRSGWTLVQGILAPIQFLVFLTSLALILRFLVTGHGLLAAEASIVVKTLTLYAIMVTGSIWEKHVFGCYLFARPFFWEDVFSILVLALHTPLPAGVLFGSAG